MKIIPYYIVQNNKFKLNNIISSILLFIIYNIWLLINNTNFIIIQKNILMSILHNKNQTPALWLIEQICITAFKCLN